MKHFALPQFLLVKKLDFVEFYLNELENTILVKYLQNVVIDLEKAKEVVEVVYPFIKNGSIYGITDVTSSFINITSEARLYYRNNKSIALSKAHAVVVKELYIRLIASFFIKFDKPVVPTRIFNDFELAYQYLLNYSTKLERNSSKVPSE